jgi:hypothetical protein
MLSAPPAAGWRLASTMTRERTPGQAAMPRKPREQCRAVECHGASRFDASVVLLDGLRSVRRAGHFRQCGGVGKKPLGVFVERGMVGFEGEQVVATPGGDLLWRWLCGSPSQRLVTSAPRRSSRRSNAGMASISLLLSPTATCPKTKLNSSAAKALADVQGAPSTHALEAAAKGLAVDGHLPLAVAASASERFDPAQKAGVEFLGVQAPEDPRGRCRGWECRLGNSKNVL